MILFKLDSSAYRPIAPGKRRTASAMRTVLSMKSSAILMNSSSEASRRSVSVTADAYAYRILTKLFAEECSGIQSCYTGACDFGNMRRLSRPVHEVIHNRRVDDTSVRQDGSEFTSQ